MHTDFNPLVRFAWQVRPEHELLSVHDFRQADAVSTRHRVGREDSSEVAILKRKVLRLQKLLGGERDRDVLKLKAALRVVGAQARADSRSPFTEPLSLRATKLVVWNPDRARFPGQVYFLTDASGLCKIGRSTNVASRIADMRIGNPTLTTIAIVDTSNCVLLEAKLHAAVRPQRVIGEWFSLSPEEVRTLLDSV